MLSASSEAGSETQESLASLNSTFSANSDAVQRSTPETICHYPKAPASLITKGRKKIRACILTESEEAISHLKEKEVKKRRKPQTQMEKSKKKKTKRTSYAKWKEAEYQESSDEAEPEEMHLDDSSEYSDDVEEEDMKESWPFQDKTPETNDFFLVELEL